MQAPPVARPASQGRLGYIIVLISSALAAISFLALPALTVTIPYNYYGSYQGPTSESLLQIAQAFGGNGTFFGTPITVSASNASAISTASIILWSLLAFAVIALFIAFLSIIVPGSRGSAVAGGISIVIISTIGTTILLLLMLLIGAANGGSSVGISVGIGGWLCFLGMLATLVGGIVVIMMRSGGASVYGYGPVMYPQQPPAGYVQYPLNSSSPNYPQYPQQPSPPNYPPQRPSQW